MKVLIIVEDDATFARTLGRSFERRGYVVHLAAGPRDVLVPQSGEAAARDLLRTTAPRPRVSGNSAARPWVRALAAALAVLLVAVVAAGVIAAIGP